MQLNFGLVVAGLIFMFFIASKSEFYGLEHIRTQGYG